MRPSADSNRPSAWQTASRGRTSRTPQARSGTASPSQPYPPSQPPKSESSSSSSSHNRAVQPAANSVWTQRGSSNSANTTSPSTPTSTNNPHSSSNGPGGADPQDETHTPVNRFNAADVKAFLSRDAASIAAYKPADAAGAGSGRGAGAAWGSKANHMANNQPFFVQLAKQVAAFEGGG